MTSWPLAAWTAGQVGRAPTALRAGAASLRHRLRERRVLVTFTLSVAALNAATLAGNAFAFRFVAPAPMGVWHTLLLASSYLTLTRLGVMNGLGRELPFALGSGDLPRARRLAATALAWNTGASVVVGGAFLAAVPRLEGDPWRTGLVAMAVVSATNLYLHAATALLMPVAVWAAGFSGLCVHAAAQSLVVTAYAHAMRPLRVAPRFETSVARELLATGLPIFAASYLQIVAAGFDRVILLRRADVEAVGYYAPAVAVLAALAVVPGAVATWAYPRMSYALGQGLDAARVGRTALGAAAVSVASAVPLAACGFALAPVVIERLFPHYAPSVPAVRWSLVAGTLWGLAPITTLLSTLKAWRRLGLYIAVLLVARWTFPWVLSSGGDPIVGVAKGNACAAALAGGLALLLARGAMRTRRAVAG